MKIAAVLFAIFVCLFPLTARAACTNPAGVETNMMYNGDYHTMQFCDGTTWWSMKGGGSGTLILSPITTVALTADNTAIDVTGISYVRFTSDNATATNRTFCFKGGVTGQRGGQEAPRISLHRPVTRQRTKGCIFGVTS